MPVDCFIAASAALVLVDVVAVDVALIIMRRFLLFC